MFILLSFFLLVRKVGIHDWQITCKIFWWNRIFKLKVVKSITSWKSPQFTNTFPQSLPWYCLPPSHSLHGTNVNRSWSSVHRVYLGQSCTRKSGRSSRTIWHGRILNISFLSIGKLSRDSRVLHLLKMENNNIEDRSFLISLTFQRCLFLWNLLLGSYHKGWPFVVFISHVPYVLWSVVFTKECSWKVNNIHSYIFCYVNLLKYCKHKL